MNDDCVDSFLDKLITAFENEGIDAFMDPSASDSDTDDRVQSKRSKFNTIESIMAMSDDNVSLQLKQHGNATSAAGAACLSTETSTPSNSEQLSTVPHLKRKTPSYKSTQEEWNDEMANQLARDAQGMWA